MSSITDKFKGFVGQIAVDLGLLTDAQRTEVLSAQAKLAALAEKGVKPTEKFLDQDPLFCGEKLKDGWEELTAQHGITQADLERWYKKATSGAGLTKEEAPASGDIAVALKFISKNVKNAILTAQAAVRTAQVLQDLDNPKIQPKTFEQIQQQHGRIDYQAKFDPQKLVNAQIGNKAADEFFLLCRKGELASQADINNGIKSIKEDAKASFQAAADMFGKLDIPAAGLIAQELRREAQEMGQQKG